jgi:hypothetical protein
VTTFSGAKHVLVLVSEDSSGEPDDEGYVTPTETSEQFYGGVYLLSAREAEVAARLGQTFSAVCHAPTALTVEEGDMIEVEGVSSALDGRWTVGSVRPQRAFQRILLRDRQV